MKEIINEYGDRLIKTTGTHGADISSQRLDDLDVLSLIHALSLEKENKMALDLGCGKGIHSLRLNLLGLSVHMYDIMDISSSINLIKETLSINNESFRFFNANIEHLQLEANILFDIVYSQRFIHYLKYEKAIELVEKLYLHTNKGGRVFISASGMNSELSSNYSCKDYSIEKRFGLLSSEMMNKHDIREPVCLYYPNELENLFLMAGYKTIEIKSSSFGNVKAVFEK